MLLRVLLWANVSGFGVFFCLQLVNLMQKGVYRENSPGNSHLCVFEGQGWWKDAQADEHRDPRGGAEQSPGMGEDEVEEFTTTAAKKLWWVCS